MKVVAICGSGRSGSTLLDALLGSHPGCFAAGELRFIWERGVLEGRRCGCGRTVRDCEVWGAVLSAPELSHVDARAVVAWQRSTARLRHLPMVLRAERARPHPELVNLARVMGDLYRVLARVTGAEVIVDSSKRPADVALLHLLPSIEVFLVHLVRDARAVAFSWGRQKTERDRDDPVDMRRMNAIRSTAEWVGLNLGAEAVRRRVGPGRSLRIRYEDLVTEPRAALNAIAALAGTSSDLPPFVDDYAAKLEKNHTVFGNPDQFGVGLSELRLDDAWRRGIHVAPWVIATLLALPMMVRYGYALRDGNPLQQRRRSGRAE